MARTVSVVWTAEALDDLDSAAEYLARDSGSYAAAFVRKVQEIIVSLRHLPESGARVLEVDDPTIREAYAFSFRVIYQFTGNGIVVLRIIHASRDFDAAWN
jgi:toxin ParE1/3/4